MKFHLWSFLHYFMIVSPVFIAYFLFFFTKTKSYETKRKIGIGMSWIAVIILIARNIDLFILNGYVIAYDLVPYQVCHLANFVLLYAFYKKSTIAFGLAFIFNLPLAYVSLIFADGLTEYTSILNIHGQAYIWGHMLIVIITLYAYLQGFIKLDFKKYVKLVIIIIVYSYIGIVLNNLFRIFFSQEANYVYTYAPAPGTPLVDLYNLGSVINIGDFQFNAFYILILTILAILITFSIYSVGFHLPASSKNKYFKRA